ncbi:MAG: glycosyltransferase family 2 protein, partial [Chthoniobacterales bacterium]
RTCIESIRRQTTYSNFDILVVDNDSREEPTLAYLRSLRHEANVAVHRREGAFNFSALNNYGVAQASGAFVVLMNNDLEVTSGEWLTEMMRHALRSEVGAVGARLWYPNGTIQHAGVILGVAGIGSHSHAGLRRDEHGYFSRPHLTQNFSAVTAACLLVRRELYLELGGLDETNLPIAFNDVDFCLRLQEKGKRIVWTPDAELIHHESASRGLEDTREKRERFLREVEFMRQKWGARLQADPAYNPNLSLAKDSEFKLAFPPRIAKPWRQS